ncbi:MAG: GNAT family N-acetyltransferase, partial [Candidatus Sumerlaeia bacterium]|nr:GNAT family N-acetyltransferase [Candidatus Sumerlaeia bacterium]
MNPSMIRPFHVERDLASCSRMLSTSEPWMTLGIDESEAARILQLPHHHNHVAVSHKDEPLGLLSLYLEGTFNGYIKLLCVAESARGQGLGAQLLRFAEDTI